MKRYLLFITVLISASTAQAFENTDLEFRLSPGIGYSNFNGFSLDMEGAVLVPLSARFQYEFGAEAQIWSKKHRHTWAAYTGLVYNFGDDRAYTWYTGLGAGYGDLYTWTEHERDHEAYGYWKVGYRVPLTKSHSWMWTPEVVARGGRGGGTLSLNLLSFSF